ncbi:hypothetical protein WJX79_010346 [Trebouxia sp. C0005]
MACQVVQTYDSFAQAFLSQVALAPSMPAKDFLCITDSTPEGSGHVAASSLEAIQYPAPDANAGPAAQSANCEAHGDRGLLTCIFADSIHGFQVQHTSGVWKDVTLPAGHVIIVPGYTLERATCGLVKATTHRVVMETSAAPNSRNALVYKLRARECAILNLYPHLSPGTASSIPARFRGPIAVSELMHFFDATHESINDSSRADRLDSASFGRPIKRVRTEAATVPPTASTPQAQTQNAQQSQVQGIHVVLISRDGCAIHFRVMPTTPLQKVFCAYAAKRSLDLDILKFLFEGRILCPDDTVHKCKIEDGDIIDVLLRMIGD